MRNVHEDILQGLREAIEYEKGNLPDLRVDVMEYQPLPVFSATDIRSIRNDLQITQTTFSRILGVSKKTVEAWESGHNKPAGSSLRLIQVFQSNPDTVGLFYRGPKKKSLRTNTGK